MIFFKSSGTIPHVPRWRRTQQKRWLTLLFWRKRRLLASARWVSLADKCSLCRFLLARAHLKFFTAPTVKKSNCKNPSWRTAAIVKTLNRHISETVCRTYDEIWHGDAYWTLTVDWPVKFKIFENKIEDGGGRHLENHKIAISPQWIDWSLRNLVRCANRPGRWKFEFQKSKMADAAISKPLNYNISANVRPFFDEIWYGDGNWRRNWRKVKVLIFDSFYRAMLCIRGTSHGPVSWQINWTTLPPIAACCQELTKCCCKKDCLKRCKGAGLSCTALCSCVCDQ